MMASTDSLSRAIAYLGAVEVAPGRYAYFSETADRYVTASAEALAIQWRNFEADVPDLHPDEPIQGFATMPHWWTPERPFAAYDNGDYDALTGRPSARARFEPTTFQTRGEAATYALGHGVPALAMFTVNLETGEEISA